jgi:hypothetical protein
MQAGSAATQNGRGSDTYGPSGQKPRVVQFLVCPQNDFIGLPPGGTDWRPSKLHVGASAVRTLRGDGSPGGDPFVDTVCRLYDEGEWPRHEIRVVVDEDWHPADCPEFATFEPHCIKRTWGAELPGRLEGLRWDRRTRFLRANSINIAADRKRYDEMIADVIGDADPLRVRVGVMGVWTHVKVEYLVFNLITVEPRFAPTQIGVCGPLCASPDPADSEAALRKFAKYLGVRVFPATDEYVAWLRGAAG